MESTNNNRLQPVDQRLEGVALTLSEVMSKFAEALTEHRAVLTHPEDPLSCLYLSRKLSDLTDRVTQLEKRVASASKWAASVQSKINNGGCSEKAEDALPVQPDHAISDTGGNGEAEATA